MTDREKYLKGLIEQCERYDAFSIPASRTTEPDDLRLSNIYTMLPLINIDRYKAKKSQMNLHYDPQSSVDVDQIIYDIDCRLYELEIEGIDEELDEIVKVVNKNANFSVFIKKITPMSLDV